MLWRMSKGLVRWLRRMWLAAGVALASVLLLEGLCRLILRPAFDRSVLERLSAANGLEDQDDFERRRLSACIEGFRAAFQFAPEPYGGWRSSPTRGECVSVDEEGRRRTVQSAEFLTAARPKRRVLLMGGSTVWGLGVRDDATIPSLLAQSLNGSAEPWVEVVNGAQLGWVSTQELIALTLACRGGERFDVVVFLDGVNDFASVLQTGKVGQPIDFFSFPPQANTTAPSITSRVAIVRPRNLALGQALEIVAGMALTPRALPRERMRPLVAQALALYAANLETAAILVEARGGRLLAYRQPHLFRKRSRSDVEASAARQSAPLGEVLGLADQVASEPAATEHKTIVDLGDLFDDERGTIFFDYCHMIEAGNRKVAERIAADVAPLLRETPSVEQGAKRKAR